MNRFLLAVNNVLASILANICDMSVVGVKLAIGLWALGPIVFALTYCGACLAGFPADATVTWVMDTLFETALYLLVSSVLSIVACVAVGFTVGTAFEWIGLRD